jgi:carboxyl-terminal processing protease
MRPRSPPGVLFVAGVLTGVLGAIAGAVLAGRGGAGDGLPWDDVRLFTEVLERVRAEYVEPVDDQRLMTNAVRGMVTALDPHSQFLDAAEYEDIRINTSGNYSGVGIEVSVQAGKVLVVAPIEDTPADKAGIRAGDVITGIDGITLDAGNANDVIGRLRGPVGTTVTLTIARPGVLKPLLFELVRSNVRVRSVRSELIEPGYAYVRISQFSETTGADLRQELEGLGAGATGEPLRGLVLDLRNNPGGVLDAAVDVSDHFLDSGVIVTARGRSSDANFRHDARSGDVVAGTPVVVVVNGGSASASEIVAGALRDNHRATLVGSRTFGKGSVQTVMPLSGGGAIKLTTSRYYTPAGQSINGEGLLPDVLVEASAPTGASADRDDPAIGRALEILKGTPAAAGGGHY